MAAPATTEFLHSLRTTTECWYQQAGQSWRINDSGLKEPLALPVPLAEAIANTEFPTTGGARCVDRENKHWRLQALYLTPSDAKPTIVARRIQPNPASLTDLHSAPIVTVLRGDPINTGGLFLITGGTGSGKTTTANAFIADRLQLGGGVAMTIEDPVEVLHPTEYPKGLCVQTEAAQSSDFADLIRQRLRAFPVLPKGLPGMLFISEVRDREVATEALSAALNGFLVITTIHALNTVSALQRFIRLAGDTESSRSAVASALRLIAHQTMHRHRVDVEFLLSASGTSSVAGHIRAGLYEHLSSPLKATQNYIQMGNDPWSRAL